MNFIKRTPLAVTGLALAFAAAANLRPQGDALRYTFVAISTILLSLFILRAALDFNRVKEELKNPIPLSVLPTSTMAAMLLCVHFKPYIGSGVVILWYAALIIQILIMLLFTRRFVVDFSIKNVFPSWFVVGVGIVTASVTSIPMNAGQIGRIVFYAGTVIYFAILPIIIYKMIKVNPLPEPARPTTAIFAAPMNLCIVGYMSAFSQPNFFVLYGMLIISVISYVYVTVQMFSLLRLKFYPTYAAFTFPYVISATAFKLGNAGLMNKGAYFFRFVPQVSEWIAYAITIYVLIRYIVFLVSPPSAEAK